MIPRDGRRKVDNNPSQMGPSKGGDEVIGYSMRLISRIDLSSSCPHMLSWLVEGSKATWRGKVRCQHAIALGPRQSIVRRPLTPFLPRPFPPYFISPTNGSMVSGI